MCPTVPVDMCRNFKPAPAPKFTACGGAPFGLWRIKGTDLSATMFKVIGREVSCPSTSRLDVSGAEGFIELKDGGAASLLLHFAFPLTIRESCLRGASLVSRCEDVQNCSSTLNDDGCPLCQCQSKSSVSGLSGGSWVRTESTITLGGLGFEYCVEGTNKLTLRSTDKPTGSSVIYFLERVTRSGTPLPCAARVTETCDKGLGCHIGKCGGALNCPSATTQGECLTRQNCSWQPNDCGGTEPAACTPSDYGSTPGCLYHPVAQ